MQSEEVTHSKETALSGDTEGLGCRVGLRQGTQVFDLESAGAVWTDKDRLSPEDRGTII